MIRLMKSTFYKENETKKNLCKFIDQAQYLSMGKKCLEFEKKFSKYQGRKYAVFYNSGSSANLALIQALLNLEILKENDNVGFSALTWATNLMPLMQMKLNPVPLDVSLKNLNVNSDNLLEVLEHKKLKVLFITNLLGFCGDLDEIARLCKAKNIILLEDNCESLGSKINNIKLGNYGLASTFSFFVGHHMSTIEGGMVCTDNKELYDMLLMVRSHGWARDLSDETRESLKMKNNINDFYEQYSFYVLGYNLRPTEINGFLGLEQLKYIEEITNARNKNFIQFHNGMKNNPDFLKIDVSHMNFVSNFAFPLICKDQETFKKYKNKFKENNVEIRPIVGGSLVEQPFFKSVSDQIYQCPNARKIHNTSFYFPNNPELTREEKSIIINLLRKT